MADKEKKVTKTSDVEKATTDESKAAAKVAKAAKGNANKKDKPNFFVRTGKGIKRFFKDFKGECKKIVWPDAKTVLKSTGVVLLVVTIVCIVVYGIDQGLSAGIGGLKSLANPEETTEEVVETTLADEKDDEKEDETAESEETTEEATTAAEETTSEKAE
ncbi:MAG: preprotein translocase subunit SecE [Ruminococcaceae bacterium]|nr:preprotein translocase subunit SecE [Oscillospiraceae bacterium]